jgi:hypothetical protein
MDSSKRTARVVALAYALMCFTGAFELMYVPKNIVVRGDAAATAVKLVASEFLVRLSLVSGLVSGASAIVFALLLYRLMKRVNQGHALLTAILLVAQVPITFLNLLNVIAALIVAQGGPLLSAFSKAQLDALAMLFLQLFSHGNLAAEIFMGLWLFPFGLLVYRSGFMPRIMGVLLIIGGFAYVIHSLAFFLVLPGRLNAVYQVVTLVAQAAAEAPVVLWLLIKGADFNGTASQPPGPR